MNTLLLTFAPSPASLSHSRPSSVGLLQDQPINAVIYSYCQETLISALVLTKCNHSISVFTVNCSNQCRALHHPTLLSLVNSTLIPTARYTSEIKDCHVKLIIQQIIQAYNCASLQIMSHSIIHTHSD